MALRSGGGSGDDNMDGAGGPGGSGGLPSFRRESVKVCHVPALSLPRSPERQHGSDLTLTMFEQRSFSTMAESHRDRDGSPATLFVPHDDHYNNEHPAQRARLASSRIALPQRYPGDGFDYRRPTMSGSGSGSSSGSGSNGNGQDRNPGVGVIDLTEEDDDLPRTRGTRGEEAGRDSRAQRGPRFGRNIIDLDGEDDAEDLTQPGSHAAPSSAPRPNYLSLFPARAPTTTHPHPRYSGLRRPERSSPPRRTDMEDLTELRTRLHARPSESSRGHRSVTPYPNGRPEPIDLTGDEDELVIVDARTRAGINDERPSTTAGMGTRSVNDLFAHLGRPGRLFDRVMAFSGIPRTNANNVPARAQVTFVNPDAQQRGALQVNLDFGATAFDLGLGGNPPPPPKYEPPPSPAKGFTRSPGEQDVVVCPNCGNELAVNSDEKKAEVWIIKKCGHVSCFGATWRCYILTSRQAYCGDCAQHRTKTTKGKGKAPVHSTPMPFKECVIHGCREKAGAKAMMHIFIGS